MEGLPKSGIPDFVSKAETALLALRQRKTTGGGFSYLTKTKRPIMGLFVVNFHGNINRMIFE
jgi:hypothetical protein